MEVHMEKIKFNIINKYNVDNKSLEELKQVFNQKLFNVITELEKDVYE